MSSKGNEALKTITVAGLLCIVCSIIVSSIVVSLRPQQAANAVLDMKKNILMSAGIIKAGATKEEINTEFDKMQVAIINFETGESVSDIDKLKYNQDAASNDPAMNVKIPAGKDVGGLSSRAKYAKVYYKKNEAGELDTVILNVRSKGLWSTMKGFIALGSDANTIKGFAYYAHGETPGLGGEVDNPNWKSQWIGKKLYGESGTVDFKVAKGTGSGDYQVDGLSGATITANGVTYSMQYWFGDHGYSKILEKVRAGEI